MSIFIGAGTALVTPFHEDGSVNFEMYEKLVNFQIENGIDAIITCGTTGEASTLNDEEHISVIRAAVEYTAGRVPVIAGTGSNHTEHGAMLAKEAQKAGADACLVVTPYYNKTSAKGLIAHYKYIADSTDLPIILYNVPSRTAFNISSKMAYELSKIENIVAIKEASSNIVQIAEIAEFCGDRLDIYSGNDDTIVSTMSLGGKGVISTMGNIIPRQTHDMVMEYLNGNTKASLKLQLEAMGLIRALFCETNPIPVKEALRLMGYDVGGFRMPLVPIDNGNQEFLISEMKKYGLI